MSSDGEVQITLSLSRLMMERLEEVAREAGVSRQEKAETILNLALIKDYQPRTPEEYRSMNKENKKKLFRMLWEITCVMYRNLFRAIFRTLKQMSGINRRPS